MELLISGISLVMNRKDSRRVIIASTILLLTLLLAVQNGVNNSFTGGVLILSVLGAFLSGINFSFAYTYVRLHRELILQPESPSRVNHLVELFSVGYIAFGTTIFSTLLGFLGLSAMLSFLPYEGEQMGYIGLIILMMATYTLARKVARPNVC